MTKSKRKNNIKYGKGGGISEKFSEIVNNNISEKTINSKLPKHIIITIYAVLCVIVSYYIKLVIADDYTLFLLEYVYSYRNQKICGNNPIEKDTIRYNMSSLLTEENVEMKNVLYSIILVIFVSFVYILIYLFASNIPFLAPFEDVGIYVTNLFVIIIMFCAIGFRNNYLSIQDNSDTKLYNTHILDILDKNLLPNPPKISIESSSSTNMNSLFNNKIKDNNGNNNTNIQGLYSTLVSRIMYVDNLNSFQDAVNKWNGFKTNVDILPYLILTNNTTNNITPETVMAKDYYNIWINELSNNSVLKNTVAQKFTNSIIYNLDIYTEKNASVKSTLSNMLVITYIDTDSCKLNYTQNPIILPGTCNSNIQNIPTALTKDIVTYIGSNILPYINSVDNRNKDINQVPSTINGITSHFQVLIGTQNVNNDYTILYNIAQQIPNNTNIINSLYWLSNLSNGDPREYIDTIMDINTKLYYIVNVLLSYLPFHFAFKKYSSFTVTIVVIITCIIIPVFILRLYFSYKTLDAYNKQFNQSNNTSSAKISSIMINIFTLVVILSIILTIFYVI